ncbi:MAG: T9SS type A sorting domain-containing protein [bacterium]
MNRILLLFLACLSIPMILVSQERSYEIHKRGMLHQTVFNTGELSRNFTQGNAGNSTSVPLFEWPRSSRVIIDQKEYDGQHHSLGGGIWIAANAADTAGRLKALCGGVGSSSAEIVSGIWSYPLSIKRTENYPVLSNGDLNPAYNPNEAEEIILARWATPTGITVTRTSRAWSYPDYDDFIIYEYEFENTGNRNANEATIESNAILTDVVVSFAYGFAPSMFGHMRTYNRWYYTEMEANARARFDFKRWLDYNTSNNGLPEPNSGYFTLWGSTKKYGGSLLSPQAVGFSVLYFDNDLVARKSETSAYAPASDSLAWDKVTGKLRQPWANYTQTSNMRSSKNLPILDIANGRAPETGSSKVTIYNPGQNRFDGSAYWIGRGSAYKRVNGVGRILMFGPYTIPKGQKVRFSIAEVAGYGAATLQQTRSGIIKDHDLITDRYSAPPNWFIDTTFTGAGSNQVGSTYLATYPLPDYVNSKVVTVRDVTDRAIQAYNGGPVIMYDTLQYQAELAPSKGIYKFPAPFPAPGLTFSNTSLAENVISWGPQIESFSHPMLSGTFSHYEVLKADHPLGPWSKLDSVGKSDPRYFSNGIYKVKDRTTKVGATYYYTVISVDNKGNKSGQTNMAFFETQIGGTDQLEKVYVVPNPFIGQSGFGGATSGGVSDTRMKIGFYNLPKVCTIRVYSFSGQLVTTIQHESGSYSTEYLQVTRNNQVLASGVYFYVVQTPEGNTTNGKFVVIH